MEMDQYDHGMLNRKENKKRNPIRNSKRVTLFLVAIIIVSVCVIFVLDWMVEDDAAWSPDYPKADLSAAIMKDRLSEEEYRQLFHQTGLGKQAVDEVRENNPSEQWSELFNGYQENFFSSGNYDCDRIGIITFEERVRNGKGIPVGSFQIPDLKNGDVLITKSTHSIGWRHGHAAIVTDAARGETLEAILLGQPSAIQNVSKWQSYSSFILLRLKNDNVGNAERIAKYAKDNMNELSYWLLTGIPQKSPKEIKKTQCSHLVWYPYNHFGYDIDSDGSWLVTPKDIANSGYFEVVQVFGVNPEEIWP